MKKPWSKEEIEYLKLAYGEGKREKIIAAELERSESSVHKALSRFKIRCKRDYSILERQSCLPKRRAAKPIIVKAVRLDKTFNGRDCNWVSADEVLRYLTEKSECFKVLYRHYKPFYIFQNLEVSLTKVLLEANRIRLAEGLPIFHLEEVTE